MINEISCTSSGFRVVPYIIQPFLRSSDYSTYDVRLWGAHVALLRGMKTQSPLSFPKNS